METTIYTDHKGKLHIQVTGSSKDSPEKVAKGFKRACAELNKPTVPAPVKTKKKKIIKKEA